MDIFHSLKRRDIPIEYWGIDSCHDFVNIGRDVLPPFGLSPERLLIGRIEDLSASVDHVLCMNVISNLDNFYRPLERILRSARKSVIIRESLSDYSSCLYVIDNYLNSSEPLRVHVNTYAFRDICSLASELGFTTSFITDIRTDGHPEFIIGYPHHWCFAVFRPITILK